MKAGHLQSDQPFDMVTCTPGATGMKGAESLPHPFILCGMQAQAPSPARLTSCSDLGAPHAPGRLLLPPRDRRLPGPQNRRYTCVCPSRSVCAPLDPCVPHEVCATLSTPLSPPVPKEHNMRLKNRVSTPGSPLSSPFLVSLSRRASPLAPDPWSTALCPPDGLSAGPSGAFLLAALCTTRGPVLTFLLLPAVPQSRL